MPVFPSIKRCETLLEVSRLGPAQPSVSSCCRVMVLENASRFTFSASISGKYWPSSSNSWSSSGFGKTPRGNDAVTRYTRISLHHEVDRGELSVRVILQLEDAYALSRIPPVLPLMGCAEIESSSQLEHGLLFPTYPSQISALSSACSDDLCHSHLPHASLGQIHPTHVVRERDPVGLWELGIQKVSSVARVLHDSVTHA